MLPMHWGTFKLAPHPWAEPAERVARAAAATDTRIVIPRPGQPFEPGSAPALDPWRRALAVPATGEAPATAESAPEGAPA